MPFDPHFALSIMLPLAEAAYDLTKLPPGWKLIAPIEPADFGFIAVSKRATVISFRGTEVHSGESDPNREWLEDFDGIAVPNKYGKGMVHQGFQDQYSALRPCLLQAIAQVPAELPLWITGHSLGGALAVSCQADFAPLDHPLAYTWAGPRVGWHDFADWFKSLKLETYRIVNEWDVVPRLPPAANGYEHVGQEILIDGGRPALNVDFFKTAHNLELSYRPGIERYAASGSRAA